MDKTSWNRTYQELIAQVVSMGYPEALGKAIARNLGSEKTMTRMIGYLRNAGPRSAEEIADEMLAIMEDRKSWIDKKESQDANSAYTALLNSGLDSRAD